MNKSIKGIVLVLFATLLVLSGSAIGFAQSNDYSSHWAGDAIAKWMDDGVVKGYADGVFKPNNDITRAEFVTIVNNIFGFVEQGENLFTDVTRDKWYFDAVNKAATAGIVQGSEGKFRPNDNISRQEASIVLYNAYRLAGDSGSAANFNDAAKIAAWAKTQVGVMYDHGYIKGRKGNLFAPKANLTRAEAVTLIDNLTGTIIKTSEASAINYEGNVFIAKEGVTLKDATISGDLFIGPGVGEGEAALDNVTVKGRLVAMGGGENSVILTNSNVEGSLVVVKQNGKIRILAKGSSELKNVQLYSGAKLEGEGLEEGKGFGSVEVIEVKPGQTLTLDGDFEAVTVNAANVEVTVEEGSVGELNIGDLASDAVVKIDQAKVDKVIIEAKNVELKATNSTIEEVNVTEKATGTKATVGEGTEVTNLKLNASIEVTGTGEIETVEANASGSTFEKQPAKVTGTENVSVVNTETGTAEMVEPGTTKGSSDTSGGSSDDDSTPSTVAVTSISLDKTAMTLMTDGIIGTVTATVYPADATNKTITWSSSDEDVATVANGVVTPIAAGTATITATTADGNKTATCAVTVEEAKDTELQIIISDQQEIWVTILDIAENELMLGLTEDNFTLSDSSGNVEFLFNDPVLRNPDIPDHEYLLSPVEGEFAGTYTLTFSKIGYQSSSQEFTIGPDFTPGEGGSLPEFPTFSEDTNKIGGLYVDRSYRVNEIIVTGSEVTNYPVVDLYFNPASEYGADGYTLQYSSDSGSTWQNYQYHNEDVTTDNSSQDNFSLSSPGGDYQYRLLVNGGEYNGYTSNEVEAQVSNVATTFTGWGMDESMWLTGVMTPYVGCGKEASFTAEKLPDHDGSDLTQYLSYQWYRVNPVTYEMTEIPGATDLTYTTVEADAGYRLLCRATGDGVNVGGFVQIFASDDPIIFNKAYVDNVTAEGFRLNLYRSVSGLAVDDLELYYYDNNQDRVTIPINSVTGSGAVFEIGASLASIPQDVESISLTNISIFWMLGEEYGWVVIPIN